MTNQHTLKSFSSKHAIAILSVDNIKLDEVALDLLSRVEQELTSYEQAREEVIERAKLLAENNLNKMSNELQLYAHGSSVEDDPYIQPNGVLINKLVICNTVDLNTVEISSSAIALQ